MSITEADIAKAMQAAWDCGGKPDFIWVGKPTPAMRKSFAFWRDRPRGMSQSHWRKMKREWGL